MTTREDGQSKPQSVCHASHETIMLPTLFSFDKLGLKYNSRNYIHHYTSEEA